MGFFYSRQVKPIEEVVPQPVIPPTFQTVSKSADVDFEKKYHLPDSIPDYCKPLLYVRFYGQTGHGDEQNTDHMHKNHVQNMGLCLRLVDKLMRGYRKVTDFTGTGEEYIQLLNIIAVKRKRDSETADQRLKILEEESARFIKIYHDRGAVSQELEHDEYWGTRQQLLAGKVIGDWVDAAHGPLDPIFGVLLNPTAGRIGPGDSGWFHNLLFDGAGHMAYHAAVHDGFGYLKNYHGIGPGYDYLDVNTLDDSNPLAGHLSGIEFWKETINEVQTRHRVIKAFTL